MNERLGQMVVFIGCFMRLLCCTTRYICKKRRLVAFVGRCVGCCVSRENGAPWTTDVCRGNVIVSKITQKNWPYYLSFTGSVREKCAQLKWVSLIKIRSFKKIDRGSLAASSLCRYFWDNKPKKVLAYSNTVYRYSVQRGNGVLSRNLK